MRSNQLMLKPAAHRTACKLSLIELLRCHRFIRWSAFKWPMMGSIGCLRLSDFFSSSVRLLTLPRCLMSRPKFPGSLRNLTSWVGSQGRRCSMYSLPEKYCQVDVSSQRWMRSLSLSLKACLRYSSETISRLCKRGRPALGTPAPAITSVAQTSPSLRSSSQRALSGQRGGPEKLRFLAKACDWP